MDAVVQNIYDYSSEIGKMLNGAVKEELKKRLADSFLVAYGAREADPIRGERNALLPSTGKHNSSIYFTDQRAESSIAAMLNGSMTRYLDFNDTYLSKEALHPSDNFPPLVALAESLGKKGKDLLEAAALSYSVICGLSDAVSIRDRGWDHVTYISISTAAGLAYLGNLESKKFENCISIGINNNISLRQTRAGELSMWKGLTASNASRNSVFAYYLAESGVTGPSDVFTGEMGFFKQVSGKFTLHLDMNRILKTMIKNYPVEYHAMSAVESCESLHSSLKGDIKNIEVETFSVADRIIIKDPEKKRPKTKETADHSMPYLIAYTLLYGRPGPESYSPEHLNDKRILALIDKMKFTVSERFDQLYPEHLPFRVEIKTSSEEVENEIIDPKGHHRNPFTWDDILQKGRSMMSEASTREIVTAVKTIENRDISEIMEILADVHP
ncbi:MAG: MmgE/PrpD family protein [Candidatus Thermoplasmatota archaeon]|nr:MmgE/PrpD family protein [Candidatus Thermoplasmatota archaeon]